MVERIPQRGQTDCAICVLAMVMGHSFDYERVLSDSERYEKISPDGKYYAWWEPYLRDEGFVFAYRPFMDLYQLHAFNGAVVGILGLDFLAKQAGHIVCVDEFGVVDPADGAPDHMEIAEYILSRIEDGARFQKEFLAVQLRTDSQLQTQ